MKTYSSQRTYRNKYIPGEYKLLYYLDLEMGTMMVQDMNTGEQRTMFDWNCVQTSGEEWVWKV